MDPSVLLWVGMMLAVQDLLSRDVEEYKGASYRLRHAVKVAKQTPF